MRIPVQSPRAEIAGNKVVTILFAVMVNGMSTDAHPPLVWNKECLPEEVDKTVLSLHHMMRDSFNHTATLLGLVEGLIVATASQFVEASLTYKRDPDKFGDQAGQFVYDLDLPRATSLIEAHTEAAVEKAVKPFAEAIVYNSRNISCEFCDGFDDGTTFNHSPDCIVPKALAALTKEVEG